MGSRFQADRSPAGATRAPAESPDLHQALVESSSELITLLDREGRIAFANPAARDVLGFEPAELDGRRFDELLEAEEAFEAEGLFRRLMEGVPVRHETTARRRDGSRIELVVNSRPVLAEDGSVQGIVSVSTDVTELNRLRREYERMANEDPLTGLANRRRFFGELRRHLAHAGRYGWRGALLVIDLDRLKAVNDSLGHAAGDRLLREVGERLRRRLRETDLVARLGGDEFVVLAPEAGPREASRLGDEIVELLGGEPYLDGTSVTASVGIAAIDRPARGDELLARADQALYRAKSTRATAILGRAPRDRSG